MVGTSSSSSSSCASFGSFDDVTVKAAVVKFVCSYGGKILPRYPDGKLRYVGGETRVLAVDRSVSFSELQVKMGELCGWGSVSLRCQLPTEDLDALISVKSDEDLANLFEEYDVAGRDRLLPLKIRAFLLPRPQPKAPKNPSHPIAPPVRVESSAARVAHRCPSRFSGRPAGDQRPHGNHNACLAGASSRPRQFLVHHGNHWQ